MCGICGVYNLDGSLADARAAAAMRDRLAHRGPDDEGLWSEGPVALGFRRLSILDIEGGHQPMLSEDGRLVVVFNGEIYNHPVLQAELEASGPAYRTRSDTETLLRLYEREGASAFGRFNGMFAVGLWDRRKAEIVLARDPLGVKPLYYARSDGRLLFSSELRALLAAGVPRTIDPDAVLEYLAYGCVHAPRTILAGVRKLPPGHLLRARRGETELEVFWRLPPRPVPRSVSMREAEAEVERLLDAAVRRQLLSDVPVGTFLSGGVDSSLVTALMARAAGRPIATFSIGFSGTRRGLDESAWARKVSRHLGTDHHELILPASVLDRIEELSPALDEPIADSAILPTGLLARFARESVKVVLTGEGADELFAGYNRYKAARLSDWLRRMTPLGRGLAAPFTRRLGRGPHFDGLPLESLRHWARANALSDMRLVGGVCRADFLEAASLAEPGWMPPEGEPLSLEGALLHDLRTVLCDSLLMKVDKAAMRASLEARVPFLDRPLVEYATSLPGGVKLRDLKGKYLLRRVAARYLPRDVAWRRKHGFIVPWEQWLSDPRSRRIDDMLGGSALESMGVFDMPRLRGMRRRLVAGQGGVDSGLLFRVAMFGLWADSLREYRAC